MISSNLDEYNHLWYLFWLWKNSIRNNSIKESQVDLWAIYYRQEENQWKSQISSNSYYQLIIESILYLISWISIKDNNWNNHKLKKNSWFIYIYKSFSKWQNSKILWDYRLWDLSIHISIYCKDRKKMQADQARSQVYFQIYLS